MCGLKTCRAQSNAAQAWFWSMCCTTGEQLVNAIINFLQINLHRNAITQNLMLQIAADRKSQVLLIFDPNWIPTADNNWTSSADRSCAVLLTARASFVAESDGSG
jgi:hypothetical protein